MEKGKKFFEKFKKCRSEIWLILSLIWITCPQTTPRPIMMTLCWVNTMLMLYCTKDLIEDIKKRKS